MTPGTEELPTDMGALADRCEQATGPDLELDRAIKNAIGEGWDYAADWGPRENCNPVAKAYTSSLDAAMTLVPKGMEFTLYHWRNASKIAPYLSTAKVQLGSIMDPEVTADYCYTPALALCAAALRARAHLQEGVKQ